MLMHFNGVRIVTSDQHAMYATQRTGSRCLTRWMAPPVKKLSESVRAVFWISEQRKREQYLPGKPLTDHLGGSARLLRGGEAQVTCSYRFALDLRADLPTRPMNRDIAVATFPKTWAHSSRCLSPGFVSEYTRRAGPGADMSQPEVT